jgi:uncharacterized protein DUF7024
MIFTLVRALVIVAALATELYAVFAVMHPHVDAEYRAYYIDRSTIDWNPPHYPATPEQGIDFAHVGWPDFVRNGYGFSYRENEGRWTDAAFLETPIIIMNRQFSGPLCLHLRLRPAYAEIGHKLELGLGNSADAVKLVPEFNTYYFRLNSTQPANALQLRFDGRVPADSHVRPGSADTRRLGVEIASLRIMSSACPQSMP